MKALDKQVGGDHYKKLKIQPMQYSMANNLDACQHTAIKYITRFRDKGGIEDLHKAIQTLEMLIEFEQTKNERACLDCHHEALCDLYDKCQKSIRANDTAS